MLAIAGHPAHGPPAEAPRAAAPADVRRAGRPPGRGHAGPAPRRRRVCHAGRRQVAPGRERRVAAPERGLRRLLRLPVGVGHVQRVARPRLLPGDRLLRGAHGVDAEHALQQVLRARDARRSRRERGGGHHPRPLAPRRHVVRLLDPLHPPHGRLAAARGSSITARAAPTSTTTRSSASSVPHRRATPTRTRSSSWTTSSDGSCASWKPAASSSTR